MQTFQDLVRRRQQSEFIGRVECIRAFQDNLALSPRDERRRQIFSVHGQGGVGKTSLLRQFRKLAEDVGTITAYVDEFDNDVLKVMAAAMEYLCEGAGVRSSRFSERYREYRKHRRDLEMDPEVPQGFPAYLGKTLVTAGIRLGRRIPAAGTVLDFVDEDAVASQAGEWAAYIARKIGNRDDVELVRDPVAVLTPLFASEVTKIAEGAPVLLVFDTYERTSEFLDPWLRDLLDGVHGTLPLNLTLIIGGRDELDRNRWIPYAGLMNRMVLDSFTEAEARDYLTCKGLTDEHLITTILALSGRLPLLVAMLASESPNDPSKIGDPSGTAVERFLKWVDAPLQREAAVDVALCRSFNLDVLEVIVGKERAESIFSWLQRMPFVVEKDDAWYYHQVVRSAMLRLRKRRSPQSWAVLHRRLAEHYRVRSEAAEGSRADEPEAWEDASLEHVYHHLCATRDLAVAVNGFVVALERPAAFSRRWAETLIQAGADSERRRVAEWGGKMSSGLKAGDEKQHLEYATLLTAILEFQRLDPALKPFLLRLRGRRHRLAKEYRLALEDLDRAVAGAPEDGIARYERGEVLRILGRRQESLEELERAIALRPAPAPAIGSRGALMRSMGRYEDSLRDLDESLRLNPGSAWARTERGHTLRLLGRNDEALAELESALKLEPSYAYALAHRGVTQRLQKSPQDGVASLTAAIEANPHDPWYYFERGECFRVAREYEAAIRDFDRALELHPQYARAYARRALTNRVLTDHGPVLADLARAVELSPRDAWIRYMRAMYLRVMGRFDEAIIDADAAVAADPAYAPAASIRGYVLRSQGDVPAAVAEFDRALALNPGDRATMARRGIAKLIAGDVASGVADCEAGADEDPSSWLLYLRGMARRVAGRTEDALSDFSAALRLADDPTDSAFESALVNRGLFHLALGHHAEAREAYGHAARTSLTLILHEGILDLRDFLLLIPDDTAAEAVNLLETRVKQVASGIRG